MLGPAGDAPRMRFAAALHARSAREHGTRHGSPAAMGHLGPLAAKLQEKPAKRYNSLQDAANPG